MVLVCFCLSCFYICVYFVGKWNGWKHLPTWMISEIFLQQTKDTHGGKSTHHLITMQIFLSLLVKKRILWKKHFTFFLNFSWELCSFFRPFLFLPIHVLLWHEAVWCCITIFVFFLVGNLCLCSVHWTLAGAPFHDNLTTKSNYSTLSIFLSYINTQ